MKNVFITLRINYKDEIGEFATKKEQELNIISLLKMRTKIVNSTYIIDDLFFKELNNTKCWDLFLLYNQIITPSNRKSFINNIICERF